VMVDLEFADLASAEAFVSKMEKIWGGPGKAVMHDPSARITECVEAKSV
jgi:hypothetical protein